MKEEIRLMRSNLTALTALTTAALLTGTAGAVVVVNEGFELPDVDAAQSDGNTSGAIPGGWIGATQGHRANNRGVIDESHGDFIDPVGEQAFAFRYTNSGLTSGVGLIGTMAAGETYDISFDVVMDGHNDGLPWRVKLVAFEDGALRDDIRNNNGTTVLYEDNGDASNDGLYTTINFQYTADEVTDAALLGKDLAVRFIGATHSATIDNVVIDVTPPGPEFFLKLQVDTATGQTTLFGRPSHDVDINYYQIASAGGSLDASGWNSLADQDFDGNGPPNGSGNGWEEAGGSGSTVLGDGYLLGESTILAGTQIDLGTVYDTSVDAQDLVFLYRNSAGLIYEGLVEYVSSGIPGDFDGDGDIDGVDIATMFSNFNGPGGGVPANPDADLDGDGDCDGVDVATIFTLFTGPLTPANVPEPNSLLLVGLGALAIVRRRHRPTQTP